MDQKEFTTFFDDYIARKLHDVEFVAWKLATETSAAYVNRNMHTVRMFKSDKSTARNDIEAKYALLEFALSKSDPKGLALEFGVHQGRSINFLSGVLPKNQQIHGFDSFEGLPGEWIFGRGIGHFSTQGKLPEVPPNVVLHQGWFDQTLPKFLETHPEHFGYVHIDSDLYSSAKCIFDVGRDRFVSGTVIVFDEYFNYPGWELNEFRAFQEFITATGKKYEYIGCAPRHYSVAVKLL
jgi:hypothetical protein